MKLLIFCFLICFTFSACADYATEGDENSSHVMNIQEILKDAGYYKGPINGNFDHELSDSLRTLFIEKERELSNDPCVTVTDDDWIWLLETDIDTSHPDTMFEVGSIISLGQYKDDDLLWTILAVEDERALLLSQTIFNERQFNKRLEKTSWSKSSLQLWLNEDFFKSAFSPLERDRIADKRLFLLCINRYRSLCCRWSNSTSMGVRF